MQAAFFTVLGLILLTSGIVVLSKVREKLPRYLVSAALIIMAIGALIWAVFLYRLKDWGAV